MMPDLYLLAKLTHLFAMAIMLGATVINAVIHLQAKSSTPIEAAALLHVVMRINRMLMGPSLVVIPLSGLWLMHIVGYDFWTEWLGIAVGLSLGLFLAFIIGDRVERRLFNIANRCAAQAEPTLPAEYRRTFGQAAPIGGTALVLSLAALVLMIIKPF